MSQTILQLIARSTQATLDDDLKKLDELIQQGESLSDVAEQNEENAKLKIEKDDTALILAAKNQSVGAKIIKHLLSRNEPKIESALVNKLDQTGYPALFYLLQNYEYNAAEDLIAKGADLNFQDKSGNNLLVYAIHWKRPKLLNFLLTHKELMAMLHQNVEGNALIARAVTSGNLELVTILIDNGIKLDHINSDGDNLLHYAANDANFNLLKVFLKRKDLREKINDMNKQYATPLSLAAQKGDLALVALLIKHGANPMIPNNVGEKPIDIARQYGFDKIVAYLKKIEESPVKEKTESKVSENETQASASVQWNKFIVQAQMIIYGAGHTLGLSTKVPMLHPISQQKVLIPTEGAFALPSLSMLKKLVGSYVIESKDAKESAESRHLKEIDNALKVEEQYLKHEDPKDIEPILNRCNAGKLSFIPSYTSTHGISVGILDGFIFVTNRDKEKGAAGSMVYKLKEDIKWDEATLRSFASLDPSFSLSKIQEKIDSLIDSRFRGIPILSKPQGHGTCSFANAKSAIEPALFVQKLIELPKNQIDALLDTLRIEPKQLDETPIQPQLALKALQDNLDFQNTIQYAEKHYKRFTRFIRDESLDQLIKHFVAARNENREDEYKIYKILLQEYLLAHHGQGDPKKSRGEQPKPMAEIERAKKIFAALDPKEVKGFLEGIKFNAQKRKRTFDLKYTIKSGHVVLQDASEATGILSWFNTLKNRLSQTKKAAVTENQQTSRPKGPV